MPTSTFSPIAVIAVLLALAPEPASAQPACRAPGHASISQAQIDAAAKTKKAFEKALRDRGLSKATLRSHSIVLFKGINGPRNWRKKSIPQDVATKTTVNGVTGLFIGGPASWSGSALRMPRWEFVENAKGEIFRLERRATPVNQTIRVCGCRPNVCGPYGSGCPACGSTSQLVFGPLPPGAVYKGVTTVSYDEHRVVLEHTGNPKGACVARKCPAGKPSQRR